MLKLIFIIINLYTMTCRIHVSINNAFLCLKISPKMGVRLILKARCNDQLQSQLILTKTCDCHICLLWRRHNT